MPLLGCIIAVCLIFKETSDLFSTCLWSRSIIKLGCPVWNHQVFCVFCVHFWFWTQIRNVIFISLKYYCVNFIPIFQVFKSLISNFSYPVLTVLLNFILSVHFVTVFINALFLQSLREKTAQDKTLKQDTGDKLYNGSISGPTLCFLSVRILSAIFPEGLWNSDSHVHSISIPINLNTSFIKEKYPSS